MKNKKSPLQYNKKHCICGKKKKQKVISYPQSQDSTHSNWKMNKNINTLSKHQWKGAKELLFKANIPL